jgi:imidazolonepropionase-like amidohydrolase
MDRDGVRMLAGTDIVGPQIPGFSVHDELSTLVRAGLTTLQALQTATQNPALVLNRTQDFGSVEAAKSLISSCSIETRWRISITQGASPR